MLVGGEGWMWRLIHLMHTCLYIHGLCDLTCVMEGGRWVRPRGGGCGGVEGVNLAVAHTIRAVM